MTPRLIIVTGASRGMGAAIAEQLLRAGNTVLGISRGRNDALDAAAALAGARCEQWSIDLGNAAAAALRLEAWLGAQDGAGFAGAILVNNAARLTRIGAIDDCDPADLSHALRVGLEAPMLLAAAFLRATRGWACPKQVLNISSGLGRFAMAGQAPYCAVKSGMDHFTRALAMDEAARPDGARVVSLAPGVVDTDMQADLRNADPAAFPERRNFRALKDGGKLTSAADAAARVIAYLERADFGSKPVADVREA
jgi:benzil reductase ((S)-benzoin forming)